MHTFFVGAYVQRSVTVIRDKHHACTYHLWCLEGVGWSTRCIYCNEYWLSLPAVSVMLYSLCTCWSPLLYSQRLSNNPSLHTHTHIRIHKVTDVNEQINKFNAEYYWNIAFQVCVVFLQREINVRNNLRNIIFCTFLAVHRSGECVRDCSFLCRIRFGAGAWIEAGPNQCIVGLFLASGVRKERLEFRDAKRTL